MTTVTLITERVHAGEYLVSEAPGSLSREVAVITGANDLAAGTVLGKQTIATSAAAATIGTNTGNGTFGSITTGAGTIPGAYTVRMESATTYVVEDPTGAEVGHGVLGAAFASGGLGFTLTAGGTAFVAGDSFTLTPGVGTQKLALLNPTATDGTEVACAILYNFAGVSGGDVSRTVTARQAEVNGLVLTWPTGITNNQQLLAMQQLATLGIIVRT